MLKWTELLSLPLELQQARRRTCPTKARMISLPKIMNLDFLHSVPNFYYVSIFNASPCVIHRFCQERAIEFLDLQQTAEMDMSTPCSSYEAIVLVWNRSIRALHHNDNVWISVLSTFTTANFRKRLLWLHCDCIPPVMCASVMPLSSMTINIPLRWKTHTTPTAVPKHDSVDVTFMKHCKHIHEISSLYKPLIYVRALA